MEVIRHQDIASDECTVCCGALAELNKGCVDGRLGENQLPVISAKGEKIKRLLQIYASETAEAWRMHAA